MLKAYRRTLQKTLQQARDMNQVVEDPQVRTLADTPDKAVMWGIALGLHREVAAVLERSLADCAKARRGASGYYPTWLGSGARPARRCPAAPGLRRLAAGGLFSGSGTPDIGGMFGSLGSIGSSPASSSSASGGGGFGGGGGGGGGGGSSGF